MSPHKFTQKKIRQIYQNMLHVTFLKTNRKTCSSRTDKVLLRFEYIFLIVLSIKVIMNNKITLGVPMNCASAIPIT